MSIRTAVIGYGLSGRVFHAPFVADDPRYDLAVVVTGDPERQAAVRATHPEARICPGADELFATAGDLDLVVVATPPATHAPLATRALEAGAAVVVDKPFCVSVGEGTALLERAEELGRPLTVFQNRRWDADFLTLQALLERGALGEVRRFESRFEWWRPVSSKQWKRETLPGRGGGILFDLGTHLVDQAVRLFGPVASSHAELVSRAGNGVDDDSFLALLHESGVRSHLTMSSVAAQAGPRFHVRGSDAAYTKWGLDGQEAALDAGARPSDPGYGVEPEGAWGVLGLDGDLVRVPAERGSYHLFYDGLARTLSEGAALPVDPRDSLAVVALLEDVLRRYGVTNV